jgi:hypothetical protein
MHVQHLASLKDIWKEWQDVRDCDVKNFEVEKNGVLIGLCTVKTPLRLAISGGEWEPDVAALIFDPEPARPVADDPEPARRPGFDLGAIHYDAPRNYLGKADPDADRGKGFWRLASVRSYLSRIGAEPRTLKRACIFAGEGRYRRNVVDIDFADDGTVTTRLELHAPTPQEQEAIRLEARDVRLPKQITGQRGILPRHLEMASKQGLLFAYPNMDGDIIAYEQRDEANGRKAYFWWTFFDDGFWRNLEPEHGLPLYGLDALKNGSPTVILHEGAKAARAMRNLALEHPWYEDLANCTHLGWAGGAPNPLRTDWSPLAKARQVERVYIVSDNDQIGRQAVPKIAQQLRVPTYTIQFTGEFPEGFDLADPFPAKMFATTATTIKVNGYDKPVHQYIGPSFRECLQPATWLTDEIPNTSQRGGRPTHKLRPSARGLWTLIEEIDKFACIDRPDFRFKPDALGTLLARFAHVNPMSLIKKDYSYQIHGLCYRPDRADCKIVTARDGRPKLNVFRDSRVRPIEGDVTPFLKFIERMFPVEAEREFTLRIFATLIARPDISMHVALLLVSEMQGTGKSTLAKILKLLLGAHNTAEPNATRIVESEYTDWLVFKRLVIVHEIYEGQSWKAYQKLKTYITEDNAEANLKYEMAYDVENYVTFILCSNSIMALKIEDQDRRVFAPTVTETAWEKAQATKFYDWLDAGGLGIIKHWALSFGNYLPNHCDVPMTPLKQEMIDASESDALLYAEMIIKSMQAIKAAERMSLTITDAEPEIIEKGAPQPGAVALNEVFRKAKEKYPKDFTSILAFKRALVAGGLCYLDERMKLNETMSRVLLNTAACEAIERRYACVYSKPLSAFRSKENGDVLHITLFSNYIRAIYKRAWEVEKWE